MPQNGSMKLKSWATKALAGLLTLLVVLACVGVVRFRSKAGRAHRVPSRELPSQGTAAELARGEHLARSLAGCTECHGDTLGGKVMEENALLTLSAPNITRGRGGVVASYTGRDWANAILHGVAPRGRNLLVMPSKELRTFSDQDVAAIVRYMKTVPPVDSVVTTAEVRLLGQALLGLAGEELWSANLIRHDEPRAPTTPSGPTVAHGEYLLGVCKGCHGPALKGGLRHGPDAPLSADISAPAMQAWSREQLERLFRDGLRRDGTKISDAMPWRALGRVTDDELTAMWLALRE
jgi:mono/diheme cytochrome c family protein